MLFHYTVQYENSIGHLSKWPITFPMMGRFGVIVFFILSGYLSLMHVKENDTLLSYGIKRATRLYPAYWVGIVLTSVVVFFLLPRYLRTPLEILINFTMLQGFVNIPNVDGVYWTLLVELIFYCFIGMLILLKSKKHILKFCFVWLALIVFIDIYNGQSIFFKILNILLLVGNGHTFIIGIALYNMNKYRDIKNMCLSIFLIVIAVLYGFLFVGITEGIFLLVVSLSVLLVTNIDLKDYACLRPVKFFAQISYPLYLVHQFIGYAIIYNIERIGLTNEIFVLIPVAVSTLLAFLIHKFVEKPVISLTKKYMKM